MNSLHEGDLRPETRRPNRRDEPGRARADDDQIVPAGGRRVCPLGGMNVVDEGSIVFVAGLEDSRRLGRIYDLHHAASFRSESCSEAPTERGPCESGDVDRHRNRRQ
jgi:hypothetical protein